MLTITQPVAGYRYRLYVPIAYIRNRIRDILYDNCMHGGPVCYNNAGGVRVEQFEFKELVDVIYTAQEILVELEKIK